MTFLSLQSVHCFPTALHRTCTTEPMRPHRSVPISCGPADRCHPISQNTMLHPSSGLWRLLFFLLRSLRFLIVLWFSVLSSFRFIVRPWVQTCAHWLSTWPVHQIISINEN
nr:unnamed protein product [Mus musculus]